MNKQNKAIVYAHKRGYRVLDNGEVSGIRVDRMSLYDSGTNYLRFNVLPPWAKHKIHVKVHRLAAYQKFGEFWEDGLEVDHKDGNTKNNALDNIQVVSRAENVRKAHSPFTWEDIAEIRESEESGYKVAERYGVSPSCIYGIRNRRSWHN